MSFLTYTSKLMKASLLLLLFLVTFCNVFSQRIVEKPDFRFRNTGIYRVNRIELSDEATRVQLLSEFIPGWWVAFSKDEVYLESPETGEKYHPYEVTGIKWEQKKPTPKTGTDTFLFTFPPFPKQLKTIDWRDGNTGIFGISLVPASLSSTPLPSEYNGNWLSADGLHRWTYGFYKDFAIVGNRFWNYESVQKKGKNLIVNLTSGQGQQQLILTHQKDGTCKIGPVKRLQSVYEQGDFPELTSNNDTLSEKQFFQPGSKAHIQGYIRGYDPRAGFKSGLVYCNNAATEEDFPTVVELLPDGRFSADIPLDYPILNDIIFGQQRLEFYAEPGDTLTIFIDWEDWMLADRYRNRQFSDFKSLRFMGPQSKTNADLAKIHAHIQSEGNIQFEKQARQLTPLAFKAQALKKLEQKLYTLDTLNQKFHFTPKSLRIAQTEIKNNIAEYILDFAQTRKYFKTDKPDKILDTPVTKEYFDFLPEIPFDDPCMIIPYGSWAFFNRFEYAAPFEIIYKHPDLQVADRVESTKAFWRLKDSIYSNYFNLKPSFCYEVVKLRGLSTDLTYSINADKIDSIVQISLQGITHPYLRLKASQMGQKFSPKQVSLSSPLPDSKSAAIFRKLIAPYQGKVIFVDFWSTGCGPCRSGIKAMAPLREKYKDKDIVFLFITDEKSSPLKPYNDFMADVKGEKLRIPEDDFNYLRELFQFNAIPHYETINKKGEVVNITAYGNLQQESLFDKLLEE